jgi:hypothetical protein
MDNINYFINTNNVHISLDYLLIQSEEDLYDYVLKNYSGLMYDDESFEILIHNMYQKIFKPCLTERLCQDKV